MRRAAVGSAVIAVIALAVAGAIGVFVWFSAQASQDASVGNRVNVVIYLIDTLRADRVGAYGYAKAKTPNIDALAKESVLFERHSSAAPWTLPSISTLQSSLLPCEHSILVDGQQLPSNVQTLAERMNGLGFKTGAFYSNPYAGPASGLNRGYDVSTFMRSRDAFNLGSWFDSAKGEPFFLYAHTMEVHDPYQTPDRFVAQFGDIPREQRTLLLQAMRSYRDLTKIDFASKRKPGTTDNTAQQQRMMESLARARDTVSTLYDASIFWADDNLGRVISQLKQRNLWDNTLFILTSDHGDELGERGGWQHDQSAYEELLHVPLIIKFPKGQYAGTRVKPNVASMDVLPTICDAVGAPQATGEARGMSLIPLIRDASLDAPTNARRFASMRHNIKKYFKPWKEQRGDINIVVREGMWKAIWNVEPNTVELFDLASDPGELKNLADAEKTRAESMKAFAQEHYARYLSSARQAKDVGIEGIDKQSRDTLDQIGYIGKPGDEEKDDTDLATSKPASKPTSKPVKP